MKKSLLALAALTAFAGVASAQSSVTVFGIVDMAAANVKNGPAGSIKSLSNDGFGSSQLGFRGIEDIGGGLKASFWLEGTLSGDTGGLGSPTSTWNRRSTVSLSGDFGEVRLGRDYTPTFWSHTRFDPFGTNGVGSANNLIGQATATAGSNTTSPMRVLQGGVVGPAGDPRTLTFVRADNSIGYFLPNLGGLYGQVMVAAGENRPGAKYTGARLGYAAGPFDTAVAFGKTDLVKDNLTHVNAAVSYDLGFAKFTGLWSKFKIGSSEPVVGGRDQTNWYVSARVPLGSGAFKASYGKASGHITSATSTTGAKQLAIGYQYDLSKRTALYTTYGSVKNDAGAQFVARGQGPALGTNTGFTSTGYEFGIRHLF